MVEKESLYTKEILLANKVLSSFDDDVIFHFGTDLFSLMDDFHVIDSRTSPFKIIRTKLCQNFALKCLLTSFVKLNISFKSYIISRWNFTEDTRHIELYYGKVSGQLEFKNILFKLVEVDINVLIDSSTKYSLLVFLAQSVQIYNGLILSRKDKLNEAYSGPKLMHGLGLQGFLIWLGFIKELESILCKDSKSRMDLMLWHLRGSFSWVSFPYFTGTPTH
jgi:hypothetical protein